MGHLALCMELRDLDIDKRNKERGYIPTPLEISGSLCFLNPKIGQVTDYATLYGYIV